MTDLSKQFPSDAAYQRHLAESSGLALKSGQDLYLGIQLAISSLDWLVGESLVSLGLDGFTTDVNWLYPSLEYIADFSELVAACPDWDDCVRQSIDEARRVLERWDGPVQFVDVVITARDETTEPV